MRTEIREQVGALVERVREKRESVRNVEGFVEGWIELFGEVLQEFDNAFQGADLLGASMEKIADSPGKLVHRIVLAGETFYMVFQRQLGLPADGEHEHAVLLAARAQQGREILHGRIQFYWLPARSGLDRAALWAELHLLMDGTWFGTNLTEWGAQPADNSREKRRFLLQVLSRALLRGGSEPQWLPRQERTWATLEKLESSGTGDQSDFEMPTLADPFDADAS